MQDVARSDKAGGLGRKEARGKKTIQAENQGVHKAWGWQWLLMGSLSLDELTGGMVV